MNSNDNNIDLVENEINSDQFQILDATQGVNNLIISLKQENNIQNQFYIANLIQIICRFYYRKFHTKLIRNYIQQLKDQKQRNILKINNELQNKKNQNWPFKQLFLKCFRSADEEIMMQFIHMCATTIQSNFKTYITKKRYIKGIKKVRRCKQLMIAMLKGWKCRRIYGCKKMKELRKDTVEIDRLIGETLQSINMSKQIKTKKIQYLNNKFAANSLLFRDQFQVLFKQGTWIFQVDLEQIKFKQQQNKKNYDKKFKRIKQEEKEQFQGRKFVQVVPTNMKLNEKDKQVLHEKNYENLALQDRPIQAKGKYQIDSNIDQMKKQQNQFISIDEKQTNENLKKQNEKIKLEQKNKLQKRKKYDPRKAIQQAKKNKSKLYEKKDNKQQEQIQQKEENINMKEQKNMKQEKKINLIIGQKKVKVGGEVGPRVQCWSRKEKNKKKSIQKKVKIEKDNQNEKISERLNYLQRIRQASQKYRERQFEEQINVKEHNIIDINNNSNNNQQQQYNQPKKDLDRRIRNMIQQKEVKVTKNNNSIKQNNFAQIQKYYGNYMYRYGKQQISNIEQISDKMKQVRQKITAVQNKRKQTYQHIEQLQDTYKNQYGTRYQNLMPKLGLLNAARKSDFDHGIPVLTQDSKFVQQIPNKLCYSSFWQLASKMQRNYKLYINS